MSSDITIEKSIEMFFHLTGGVGGFFVNIPGCTDVVARAISLNDLRVNQTGCERTPKYLKRRNLQLNVEVYRVKWQQDGICLKLLSSVEHNRGLAAGLLGSRGGVNVFNHNGHKMYIEDAEQTTNINPIVVPLNKELFEVGRVFDKALIADVCNRKTSKVYVEFHYGRGCFQLIFAYSDEFIKLIRKVVPIQYATFTYDDCCWKIDYCRAELIPELIELMEREPVGV